MAIWKAFRRVRPRAVKPETPVVSYSTEPAPESLSIPRYKRAAASGKTQYSVRMEPQLGDLRVTKVQALGGCLPGTGPLYAAVSHGILDLMGVAGLDTSIESRSKADARDEQRALAMLDAVAIQCHKGGHLSLTNAPHEMDAHCLSEFLVTCPRERAVTVRGVYSAVGLSDLTGGADVETTQARITVLNVSPVVNASVAEGIVDYSGHEGVVKLYAGWNMNLNFTERAFDGSMEATSEGAVRVLLPFGFFSSFEASLAKDAEFVCRADIGTQVLRREDGGRVIYTFGAGEPIIRLISVKGPIVIDNASGPWEEAVANALPRPRHGLLASNVFFQ